MTEREKLLVAEIHRLQVTVMTCWTTVQSAHWPDYKLRDEAVEKVDVACELSLEASNETLRALGVEPTNPAIAAMNLTMS